VENQNPALAHESAGSPKRGSIATNFGAIGWFAYWALCIRGWWVGGAIAGLAVFVVILAHEYSRDAVKLMDCVAAAFFAFAAIVTAFAGPWLFLRYNIFMIWGIFAVVAWITILIGRPFTMQYAHEQAPPEIWDHPLFRRLNVFLTLAWCGILTVNTLFGFAAFLTGRIISFGLLIPMMIFIAGLVFSRLYPKRLDAQFAAAAASTLEASRHPNPR
jgi:hypothetical protein